MQRPGHVLGTATWSVSPRSGDTLSPLKRFVSGPSVFQGWAVGFGECMRKLWIVQFCSFMPYESSSSRASSLSHSKTMCRCLHGFLSVSNASRKCACVHQKQSSSLRRTRLWEMLLLLFWNPVSKHGEVEVSKTLWCKRFHASLLRPLHRCSHLRSHTIIHHTFSICHSNMCLLQGTSIYASIWANRNITNYPAFLSGTQWSLYD